MHKLLAAIVAAVFALGTTAPVFAADKMEKKEEMKKDEGKKKEGKKKDGKKKNGTKKDEMKK